VFVFEFTLFLSEEVVSFDARSFYVCIEGLLDLKLEGGKLSREGRFTGDEFVVEGLLEVGCLSSDLGVEVSSLLVNTFFDELGELLVDCVFTNLIS
jgi:hypothetical protein